MELFGEWWIWLGLAGALLCWLLRGRLAATRRPRPAEPDPDPDDSSPLGPPGLEPAACALPIEDSLDLHAFSPRDIVAVADEYLWEACRAGFTEVRLIHGRGTGFQRDRVRQLLSTHPVVARYGDAPPDRGGWGATVVSLACHEAKKRPKQ